MKSDLVHRLKDKNQVFIETLYLQKYASMKYMKRNNYLYNLHYQIGKYSKLYIPLKNTSRKNDSLFTDPIEFNYFKNLI